MPKIVKLEVGEIQGFCQPAKPYRHGIGAQGWQDEGLRVQRAGETLKELVQGISHRDVSPLPILGFREGHRSGSHIDITPAKAT